MQGFREYCTEIKLRKQSRRNYSVYVTLWRALLSSMGHLQKKKKRSYKGEAKRQI